jgi:hypothetical protein
VTPWAMQVAAQNRNNPLYVKSPKEAKESSDGDVYIFYLAKFAVSLGQIQKFI